jgi:hypothetical protein
MSSWKQILFYLYHFFHFIDFKDFEIEAVSTSILSCEGHVPEQGNIVILLTESYKWRRAGY